MPTRANSSLILLASPSSPLAGDALVRTYTIPWSSTEGYVSKGMSFSHIVRQKSIRIEFFRIVPNPRVPVQIVYVNVDVTAFGYGVTVLGYEAFACFPRHEGHTGEESENLLDTSLREAQLGEIVEVGSFAIVSQDVSDLLEYFCLESGYLFKTHMVRLIWNNPPGFLVDLPELRVRNI